MENNPEKGSKNPTTPASRQVVSGVEAGPTSAAAGSGMADVAIVRKFLRGVCIPGETVDKTSYA